MQQPARVERVRDEAELEPALAQRLEQRVRVRRRARGPAPRRGARPRGSGRAAARRPRSPKSREQPPHELRVLDLLDRPRRPEERLVLARGSARSARRRAQAVASDAPRARRGGRPRPARASTRTASACRPSRRELPRASAGYASARGAASSSGRRSCWPRSRFSLRFVVPRRRHDAVRRSRRARSIPLAWLIGEATEHAARAHRARDRRLPERELRQRAGADHRAASPSTTALPDVVRGSLAGSVVSNILLVLGVALIFGGQAARAAARPLLAAAPARPRARCGRALPRALGARLERRPGAALARASLIDPGRDRAARPLRRASPGLGCAGTSACTRRAATRRPRRLDAAASRWSRSARRRSSRR